MQNFHKFQDGDYVSDAPSQLNGNFDSVMTDFKGASFPTENLAAGMTCFRSDENIVYRLREDASNNLVWVKEYELITDGIKVALAERLPESQYATQEEAEAGTDNTKPMTPLRVKQSVQKNAPAPDVMTGASVSASGKSGLVPEPKAGDNEKFLCGDGSFKEVDVDVDVSKAVGTLSIVNGGNGNTEGKAVSAGWLNSTDLGGMEGKTSAEFKTLVINWLKSVAGLRFATCCFNANLPNLMDNLNNDSYVIVGGGNCVIHYIGSYVNVTPAYAQLMITTYTDGDVYYCAVNNSVFLTPRQVGLGGVVKSYRSGSNWYRIYADGFVEQGGWYASNIAHNTLTPATSFHIPFVDKNYFIKVTPYSNGYFGEIQAPYSDRTNTNFKLYQYSANKNEAANGAFWFACGWKA